MLLINDLTIQLNNKNLFHSFSCKIDLGLYRVKGDNGVGKTTFLLALVGLMKKYTGNITLNNVNNQFLVHKNGFFVPDNIVFYEYLTGKDIINLIKKYKKNNKTNENEMIHYLNLDKYMNVKYKNMSLGTRKKIILLSAFISEVDVYIFDEPVNGIDKNSVDFIAKYLLEMSKKKIIIFTSHDQYFLDNLFYQDLNIDWVK